MPVIGNDIVDLTVPENQGKSRDRRFRARVFTAVEEELIEAAAAPDVTLWTLWAAKEAAFKAASKLRPGLRFIPREYRVIDLANTVPVSDCRGSHPAAASGKFCVEGRAAGKDEEYRISFPQVPAPPDGCGKVPEPVRWKMPTLIVTPAVKAETSTWHYGTMETPGQYVRLVCMTSARRVHCLALGNGHRHDVGATTATIRAGEETIGADRDDSDAARRALIHHLARILQVSPYELKIHRTRIACSDAGPPRVFLSGRPTDIDISLTHDGAYLAFAVRL